MQTILVDIARIGMGLIFMLTVVIDWKARLQLFGLMAKKHVPLPWLFFLGGTSWKLIGGALLTFSIYPFWAAILLALYNFLANLVFNNFWAAPKEQRGFSASMFVTHLAVCMGLFAIAGTL